MSITEYLTNCVDTNTVIIGIVVFLLAYYFRSRSGGENYPKGPFRLPLIGTTYAHGLNIRAEDLTKLAKKHGNVFSIFIGPKRGVVINGYDAIYEACSRPFDFSNRKMDTYRCFKLLNPNQCGFSMRDYDREYVKKRGLIVSVMKSLGAGRPIMEDRIIQESTYLQKSFEDTQEKAFDPSSQIESAISNIVCHVLMNKRYNYDEQELLHLKEQTKKFLDSVLSAMFVEMVPFGYYIPPLRKVVTEFEQSYEEIMRAMRGCAKQILENYEENQNSNFVDCFAEQKIKEAQANDLDIAVSDIDVEDVTHILSELLVGGFETTSTIIKWLLLFMANRPEVQDKMFYEIEAVVGTDRVVSLKDKENLPYMSAVLAEVFRYSHMLLFLVHYSNLHEDVQIANKTIPRSTMILLNIHSVHSDPDVWGDDPDVFRPERFLDENGKFVKRSELIPFSLGKRACPGRILAEHEFYLFAANMFQKFKICPPEGQEKLDETPERKTVSLPKPYSIRAILR